MIYDDSNLDDFQGLLRQAMEDIPATSEALLVGGIVISEWLKPDGKRILAKSPIGDIPDWQAQGYLFSALHGESTWTPPEIDPEEQ